MHSECVSLCSDPPLWPPKRPCVWSEWFASSRSEQISQTLQTAVSLTHTQQLMSAERRGRGPINNDCLIQPQPSSLPSSLCLGEDTTAVTQTAVYPLLLAAARGIIHMWLCQQSQKERDRERQRSGLKMERNATICMCVASPIACVLVCFHHPVFYKQLQWAIVQHAGDEVAMLLQSCD